MKNIWKWILGIVLVLAVVAALVAVPFFMRNSMAANFNQPNVQNTTPANPTNPQQRGFNGPMMRGFNQQGRGPGGFNGFNGPMMRGGRNFQRGFMPFGLGFMFLGGLLHLAIPLLFLGLLFFGAYQLGKNAGLRSARATTAPISQPVAPAEPPAVDEDETPAG